MLVKTPAQQISTQRIREKINELLSELSHENLVAVERYVRFLHADQQTVSHVVKEDNPPYLYPTVPVPASAFGELTGIMPPVGGDALADTEALYDDV